MKTVNLEIWHEELLTHTMAMSKDGRGYEARVMASATDENGNHYYANRMVRIRFKKEKRSVAPK